MNGPALLSSSEPSSHTAFSFDRSHTSISLEVSYGGKRVGGRVHLTECIYQLVLESQLPHKIVNLLFTITDEDNKIANLLFTVTDGDKLTVLTGSWLFKKRIDKYIVKDKRVRTGGSVGPLTAFTNTTLGVTQVQIDGFVSQLLCKCNQSRAASVED